MVYGKTNTAFDHLLIANRAFGSANVMFDFANKAFVCAKKAFESSNKAFEMHAMCLNLQTKRLKL